MPRSRYLLAACAALALSASACAQLDTLTGISPTAVATVKLKTGQALALAYTGLDGAALGIEIARSAGYYKGKLADEQKAGSLVKQGLAILDAAQIAYNLTGKDPTDAIASIAAPGGIIAQIKALSGK